MATGKLTHLIYASAVSPAFVRDDLKTILEASRRNNAKRSVTGMLLYSSGSFFQILEGEDSVLEETFTMIAADPRHTRVTRIIHEPITRRSFSEWTMGYSEISESELETIDGLNDFFQHGNSLTSLTQGRAKKLLAAFAQGRWRTKLVDRTA